MWFHLSVAPEQRRCVRCVFRLFPLSARLLTQSMRSHSGCRANSLKTQRRPTKETSGIVFGKREWGQTDMYECLCGRDIEKERQVGERERASISPQVQSEEVQRHENCVFSFANLCCTSLASPSVQ